MKDIKIARFVELVLKGKPAIEAMEESDIGNYTSYEVLNELSKEEYSSDWNKLAKAIVGERV